MSQKRHILNYVLAYLLLVISAGFSLLVLNLIRDTVLLAMVFASSTGEPNRSEQFYQSLRAGAVSQWSILVVGLIMVIVLIALEHFYRESVPSGRLLKIFLLVTSVQFGLLFVTHVTSYALQAAFRPPGWLGVAILAGEALLTGLFWWGWKNHQRVSGLLRPS